MIGVGAGAKAEIDLRKLMGKRGRIHGSTLRARPIEEKAIAARLVEKMVLPGFASGDLVGAGRRRRSRWRGGRPPTSGSRPAASSGKIVLEAQ